MEPHVAEQSRCLLPFRRDRASPDPSESPDSPATSLPATFHPRPSLLQPELQDRFSPFQTNISPSRAVPSCLLRLRLRPASALPLPPWPRCPSAPPMGSNHCYRPCS